MATGEVRFQDPRAASGHLLEALLEGARDAVRGGGIFAWANVSGIKLFLGDEAFSQFAASGDFALVVGVDSITDARAVGKLIDVAARLPRVHIRAFLHDDDTEPLFHPKMAWFRSKTRLTVIVGSGNLTNGGLMANWEAFTVSRLTGKHAAAAEKSITEWLKAWEHCLLPIADPRVLERAKLNTGRESSLKRMPTKKLPAETAADRGVLALVAEIPKGDRWAQAGFNLANFEGFFGAKAGTSGRIALYHVRPAGEVGEVEGRRGVKVKSRNYRFELGAAHGVDYPDEKDGRPIGVFVRVTTGEFMYMLLMPGQTHYGTVVSWLQDAWAGPERQMRRVVTNVADLEKAWPASPLWKAEIPQL